MILNFILQVAFCATTLGNPNAPQGGTFYVNLDAEPSSLNPITSSDNYETAVNSYVHDSLLSRNVQTYEWEPSIAESYQISKDGMTFTFKLRDGVTFSDGKPVTIEDIKFSYDVWFMPEYAANNVRPYYENFESVKILDEKTIQFKVKTKYHLNFDVVAGLVVYPKHMYGDPKKGKKLSRSSLGVGPYVIDKWEKGKRITLKKNPSWFGWKLPSNKGMHNFEQIVFRFARDKTIALEMLKKGDIDYLDLDPEAYIKKAVGDDWGKKVLKQKEETVTTKTYSYVAFNLERPIFQDVKVRKALAHLMNRKVMNDKFYYNMYELTAGPVYRQSEYANDAVKPIPYDPQKALALLREAGWSDTDKDGVLDKVVEGQKIPMRFTIFNANPARNKFYTMYKEDAKKVGVHIDIQLIEWNSLVKLIGERSFDAITLAWGAGTIHWDPKQIWHSSSAAKGGSNFINYKNPKVDELIDKARETLDKEARKKILAEVYRLIAEDVPYIFMFNEKYDLYAHTARMQMKQKSYKYGIGTNYWWIKP